MGMEMPRTQTLSSITTTKRVDCFKIKTWLEKKKKEHGMLSTYVLNLI